MKVRTLGGGQQDEHDRRQQQCSGLECRHGACQGARLQDFLMNFRCPTTACSVAAVRLIPCFLPTRSPPRHPMRRDFGQLADFGPNFAAFKLHARSDRGCGARSTGAGAGCINHLNLGGHSPCYTREPRQCHGLTYQRACGQGIAHLPRAGDVRSQSENM